MEGKEFKYYVGLGIGLAIPFLMTCQRARRAKLRKQYDETKRIKQQEIQTFLSELPEKSKTQVIREEWSAAEILEQIRQGKVTAEEVLIHHIKVAAYAHEKFNCLTEILFQEALEQARTLDNYFKETGKTLGPLHGLPVSIKDNIAIRGVDSSIGVLKYCNSPLEFDSVLVATLREKGAIIYCKTNVPESLLLSETYNSLFGRTVNPFEKNRTCGGSSGGEAALIASGGSPFGFGTDIGGSVRIPANFCGLVGFKPTAGRMSQIGVDTTIRGQEGIASTLGPLATCVEDVAMMMNVLYEEGMWRKDSSIPTLPFNINEYEADRRLRIGYYTNDQFFEPNSACVRAVEKTVKALTKEGHTLVPISPPDDVSSVFKMYLSLISADGASHIGDYINGEEVGFPVKMTVLVCKIPLFIRRMFAFVLRCFGQHRFSYQLLHLGPISPSSYTTLLQRRQEMKDALIQKIQKENLDAVISPANGTLPYLHGLSNRLSFACSYTLLQNFYNLPAGVVPVLTSKDSDCSGREVKDLIDRFVVKSENTAALLPVGVQVYSLPWKDEVVLRVMKEVEKNIAYKKSLRMKRFIIQAAYGEVGTLLHATERSNINIDDEPLF